MRYDAFISYSHAADGLLAPALQSALQRFAKPWYQRRALRIFRDQTSLAATPELWPTIQASLDDAGHFLLLASPEAARSKWVGREVAHWLATKPPGRLLVVLTDGELVWGEVRNDFDWRLTTALPTELRGAFTVEPLWVDLRWAHGEDQLSLNHPRFLEAVGDLAAPLRGLPKEDLLGEDIRQHKQSVRLAGAAIAGLIMLLVVAALAAYVAVGQRDAAERNASLAATETARAETERFRAENEAVRADGEAALAATEAARADDEARAARTAEAEAQSQAVVAQSARSTAEAETVRAETETIRAQNEARLALSRQLAAQSLAHTDDLDLGLLLAVEAYALAPGDPDVRHSLVAAVQMHPTLERFLSEHEEVVRTLAFSPDGRTLISGSDDGTVRLWNPFSESGSEVVAVGQGNVRSLTVRPDGKQFAYISYVDETSEGTIRFHDLVTGASEASIGPRTRGSGGLFESVSYSPDGSLLAPVSENGEIELWDPTTGAAIRELETAPYRDVALLDFSPDGQTLLSAGFDPGTVQFWNVDGSGGDPREELLVTEQGGTSQALFSSDGAMIATAGRDGTIRLWDAASHLPIGDPLSGHDGDVSLLVLSPDGAGIFSGGEDGTIRHWDIATRQSIGGPIATGRGSLVALALSPDGSMLASGGSDGTIRLWKTESADGGLFASINGHIDSPEVITVSPDGATIATGDEAGAILLWEAGSGTQIGVPLRGHSGGISALDISSDGTVLASASTDGTVRLWDMATRRPRGSPLVGHGSAVNDVTFSATGDVLISGGDDGTVRRWRSSDGAAIGDPLDTGAPVWSVSFSPSGKEFAAAAGGGAIAFWDTASGVEIGSPIPSGQGAVTAIRFVQGGMLVSAGSDGTLRYWNVVDRKRSSVKPQVGVVASSVERVVQAHEGRIGRLVANEDGTLLASAGDDGRVLLWAAGAETPLARPLDVDFRNDWVPAVDVSPDGSKIVFTGSHDAGETIVLNQWHVDDGRVDTAFPKRTRSSAELSADGTRVAAGTKDGRIVIWDTISGNLIAEHQTADDSGVWALNVRSGLDGSLVAFGSERGAVRLWDGASDSPIGSELPGQGARITALAFSDDGTLLAAGTENGLVRLWDVATGEPRGSFSYSHSSFSYSVLSLAFSPDDSLLAVSGFREISLWDIEEMRLRDAPLTGHEGRILAVDFSPDGRWFASGSEEGVVLIWDVATWQPFAGRLDEASSEIDDLAFSPDSSLIAAGTEAGEIQVWQLTARFASPLSALRVADGPIRSMAFTVDGAWLVSLDPDGVVTRWSFSEESWVKRACAIANRNLSREEWEIFIGSEAIPYHTSCPDRPGPRLDSPATPHAGNGERT